MSNEITEQDVYYEQVIDYLEYLLDRCSDYCGMEEVLSSAREDYLAENGSLPEGY